jgi:cytochrome P450
MMLKDQKTKKDALYRHKREYTKVSVAITNMLANPSIALMNPDLIR